MRQVSAIATIALLMMLPLASPAGAVETGGSSGNEVYSRVVSEGSGRRGGYPSCDWDKVWGVGLLDFIVNAIRDTATILRGGIPENQVAELVLDVDAPETNLYLDGAIAELLGRDGSFVVSYEGRDVTLGHKVVVYLSGAQPVGVFFDDKTASSDYYDENSEFPEIQRGTYDTGSGEAELWWDPFYVTEENATDDCPAGLIYSPRNADPVALIPDLQDYMKDQIPGVIPVLEPLDRVDGWAYVQVPTNFTVDPASLVQPTATAEVYDPATGAAVWATATAFPTHVLFYPGDGSDPVRCAIDDATAAFDPADPGFCSFTYLDSSNTQPGGVYEATLVVLWEGRFISSSNNVAATFPIEPQSLTFDIPVAEARAAVGLGR
jgi:hypothetical protein